MFISSLIVRVEDIPDSHQQHIEIDSKTSESFERRGLNKLLRAVMIILSKTCFPRATHLISIGVDWRSTYIMCRHFNACIENKNGDDYYCKGDDIPSMVVEEITKLFEENEGKLTSKVELNGKNIEKATTVFNSLVGGGLD